MSDQELLLDVLTRFSRTLAGHYDVSDVLYELSDGVAQVLNAAGAGAVSYTHLTLPTNREV